MKTILKKKTFLSIHMLAVAKTEVKNKNRKEMLYYFLERLKRSKLTSGGNDENQTF